MALSCFPNISKRVELEDGTHYAYSYVPAITPKPIFLLLHGFPSANYEWRHQIDALSSKGFGVLAPDLLGYGDTDSPASVEAYSMKRMSDHVVEILAKERLERVIGIAHDRLVAMILFSLPLPWFKGNIKMHCGNIGLSQGHITIITSLQLAF